MRTTHNFFNDMEAVAGFSNVFDSRHHVGVPEDWHVVIADVKGSTEAVSKGHYKSVNMVGASCIIAVLNEVGDIDIPYVFGGDGASFLIPEHLMEAVSLALMDTKSMAMDVFGLDLRVGAICVSDLLKAGKSLQVSKYKVSDMIHIAMFHGGGMACAEGLVKGEQSGDAYGLEKYTHGKSPKKANFDGLECRWDPVMAKKDQIVTLMVESRQNYTVYNEVMVEIDNIFGSAEEYRPVKVDNMKLSLNSKSLEQELGVKTRSGNVFQRIGYLMKMKIENMLAMLLIKLDVTVSGFEGKKYVADAAKNTDFQKFDDTLRVILDSSHAQAEALLSYLSQRHEDGDLFYGVSISSSVMMTCLIFERAENHLHFVDGMAGGYTVAAKNMKEQINLTLV